MVIELGTDWAPHDPGRRSPARRRQRLLVSALGCLLLVLTLAGSATPVPSWRLVATVPASINDYWQLAGDRLFVSRSPAFTAVDAYDLPGGRRLWRAMLPERPYLLLGSDSTGVLLAETAGTGPGHGQLTALDAQTGRVRWRLAGASVRDVGSVHATALLAATGAGGGDELRLVDVRTGAAVWSRTLQPGVTSEALGAGRLVLWSPAGGTQLVEESSGRILATGQPSVALSDSGSVPGAGRYVVGDQLLVTDPGERATVVTAYELATLARRWRVEVDEMVRYVAGCGPVLCVSGEHGLTALDPATGQPRWATNSWTLASLYGSSLRVSGLPGVGSHDVLLDPATGRPVLDLAGWSQLSSFASGAASVLIRGQPGRPGIWVAGLGGDRLVIRLEAWLPDAIASQCALGDGAPEYLACVSPRGPVRVWLRRASAGQQGT